MEDRRSWGFDDYVITRRASLLMVCLKLELESESPGSSL